jgi:hypothetical protein
MNTDDLLRAQLRSMYQWSRGADAPELVCREKTRPSVLVEFVREAAAALQEQIALRAVDDIRKIRERNAERAIPGYSQLEVWPEHLASHVKLADELNAPKATLVRKTYRVVRGQE